MNAEVYMQNKAKVHRRMNHKYTYDYFQVHLNIFSPKANLIPQNTFFKLKAQDESNNDFDFLE